MLYKPFVKRIAILVKDFVGLFRRQSSTKIWGQRRIISNLYNLTPSHA